MEEKTDEYKIKRNGQRKYNDTNKNLAVVDLSEAGKEKTEDGGDSRILERL